MTFRTTALLALVTGVLLAGGSPLSAQTDTDSTEVRPRITDLARAALSAPGDSTIWNEMATLLPEMARTGDADVLGAFEAARVADSLAAAPFDPVTVALQSGRETAESVRAGREVDAEPSMLSDRAAAVLAAIPGTLPWTLPWLLVGALLLTSRIVLRRRARVGTISNGTGRHAAGTRGKDRLWAVTTLARSGLPPSEIARQTGMAQDAVRVLMGMTGTESNGATRSIRHTPSASAHRPPTLGEQAAGVTAERAALMRSARRMKDGRITYGPGGGR